MNKKVEGAWSRGARIKPNPNAIIEQTLPQTLVIIEGKTVFKSASQKAVDEFVSNLSEQDKQLAKIVAGTDDGRQILMERV